MSYLTTQQLSEIYTDKSTAELTAINTAIKARIDEYCNTEFGHISTYTNERCDSRLRVVTLHRPIASVSKLIDNATELVEDTDFFVYPDRVELVSASGVRRGVTISYTAGYSDVPEAIKSVALELARYRKFMEVEGADLFYKSQTFQEREYQRDLGLNEGRILSQLRSYVQKDISGRKGGSIRVGVM